MKSVFFLGGLLLVVGSIFLRGCSTGSSCTKVSIPAITVKCTQGQAPCNGNPYTTSAYPYYALAVYVLPGTSCTLAAMQTSLSAASSITPLTEALLVASTTTYSATLSNFIDSKSAAITQVCSGSYSVCAVYGQVNSSQIFTPTYVIPLTGFNIASPSTTTAGPTGWTTAQ